MTLRARLLGLGLLALSTIASPLAVEFSASPGVGLVASTAAAQQAGTAEKDAFEASKALGTIEAWEAFLRNFPSGFHADLARAYLKRMADTPSGPTAAPSVAAPQQHSGSETVTLPATAIQVGKWPERAAFDGRSLWVSESGSRSIVEINLQTRSIGRRLRTGRLPVDMVATENGTVYALAETDNMIHALTSGGRAAGEFAEVPRCADIMAYAADTLFVVSNLNCSAPAVLTRVSHLNGRTAKVADLAAGPSDMKAAHGLVYVAHMGTGGRAAFVSIIDAANGSGTATPDLAIHYPRIAVNGSAAFVGGAPLNSSTGLVTKIDSVRAQFSAERRLGEPIIALAATAQYVVAAGRQGTLYVLSADDLTLMRTIRIGAAMEPHDVVAVGGMLAVVSSRGSEVASDNMVYLIDGWMPGAAATTYTPPPVVFSQPAYSPSPAAEPVAERRPKLRCGENYKKVRGECVLMQNCGANAYRSPEGDCYCNDGFDMKRGKCVWRQQKQPVRDNCPGDSVLRNGVCVKEQEPDFKPPIKCTGGQLYSLSQQRCVCQDGLKWNGQRCYLP